MTIKYLFLVSITYATISCNNQAPASGPGAGTEQKSPAHCYSYIRNNDTIILKTIDVNGFMTGTLEYYLYQKDKNGGTIQGRLKDGILIADYTFISEGVQSVRQVAFKQSGTSFIQGFGETTDDNGKIIFRSIDSLNFDNPVILKETECVPSR
jgi:hypothetical protein